MTIDEIEATREKETPHLTMGYHAMHAERWPMNDNIANCYDRNSAYFFHLERTYCQIPQEMTFEALKDSIPPEHRDRIAAIWKKLQRHKIDLQTKVKELKKCWKHPPRNPDKKARSIVQSSPIVIQETSRETVMALVSSTPKFQSWKVMEQALRRSVHFATKNFITTLRVYLEELIEKQGDNYVLPKNHPQRQKIVIHNRYVQLIDATIMAMSTAKAIQHQQPKGRMRKTEAKPAIFHPATVILEAIRHIIPFVIEQPNMDINPILVAIIAAVHDTSEDADVTVDEVIKKLKEILDHYDSTIDQAINSGFGQPRDRFKAEILDLMNDGNTEKIRQALRILSNKETLTDEENKTANQPKLNTFQQYDTEYDGGKIAKFLMKLHAISQSQSTQQLALLIKITDRAHNISTLDKMPPDNKRGTLRATVSKLIAYCMLDHNHEEMPLYNTLPTLIEETVIAYKKFAKENSKMMEEIDRELLEQAEKWQLQVIKLQVPAKIKEVLERYAKARQIPLPTDMVRFVRIER